MPTQEELATLVNQPTAAAIRAAILAERGLGGAYGYDSTFDQQVNDLYAGQYSGLSDLSLNQDRLNRDYSTNQGRLGENQAKELGGLRGFFADRGMTFSGANINRQSDIGRSYGQRLEDMTTDNTRGNENITRQRQSIYNLVRDSLAGLKDTYAGKVGEEQGERNRRAAEAAATAKAAADAAKRVQDRAAKAAGHNNPNAPRYAEANAYKNWLLHQNQYPGAETAENPAGDKSPIYAPQAPYVPHAPELREPASDTEPVYASQMMGQRTVIPADVGFAQTVERRDPGFGTGFNPALMPSPGEGLVPPAGTVPTQIPKPSKPALEPLPSMVPLPIPAGVRKAMSVQPPPMPTVAQPPNAAIAKKLRAQQRVVPSGY